MRFDNIKNQYQSDLFPLTAQREAMLREITELRASRDAYLEETTMLSARNEELAQLHAQYLRRMDLPTDSIPELNGRDSSLDKARPFNLSSSVTSSSTAFSEESLDHRFVKVQKPDAAEVQTSQPRGKFKWPGSRNQPAKEHASHLSESTKTKPRIEHNFQQVNGLRVARCDHCGDKMWGSIMRCGSKYLSPRKHACIVLTAIVAQVATFLCTIVVSSWSTCPAHSKPRTARTIVRSRWRQARLCSDATSQNKFVRIRRTRSVSFLLLSRSASTLWMPLVRAMTHTSG